MKTYLDKVTTNPEVMLGKPVIKGTRVPVDLIVRKLGEGATPEDLLDAYPNLNKEDIQAALLYAAEYIRNETIIYLKTGS
jgi:uncharacterized protein (DUF433 family)